MKAGPKVARRRVEVRARIISAAGHRFAMDGLGVRLEEVAEEADVARATLYSHFKSKEDLLQAIVRPTLERAVGLLARIPAAPARAAVTELLRLHLDLWRVGADAMRLAHRLADLPRDDLAPLHEAFVLKTLDVFRAAADAGILRHRDSALSAHLLAKVAVPVLEVVFESPDAEALFLRTMEGMLLKP
jgi:AcrR family transcriptional regulator